MYILCVFLLQLVNLFGNVRDDWIASDLKGWLAPNRIYPGVADAVKATLKGDDTEVYIVTTKQVLLHDVLHAQYLCPAGEVTLRCG